MPKASILQNSFSAGEVSPLVYGRTEAPRYKQGLAKALNYIPTLQGPLLRTPGTKYVGNVKDSTKPPVLIPFQFSITQAYILEFGHLYVRFYANNGQVVTSGTLYSLTGSTFNGITFSATRSSKTPLIGEFGVTGSSITPGTALELVTPYHSTDIAKLKWAQDGDTIYLFHPSYPVYKIQRSGAQEWRIVQVLFTDGPYFSANSILSLSDSTNVVLTVSTTGANSFATAGPSSTVGATASGTGGQVELQFTTAHNFITGQNVYVTGIVGTTEANNGGATAYYWPCIVTAADKILLVGCTFVNAWVSGGTCIPGLFGPDVKTDAAAPGTSANQNRQIAFVIAGVRYVGWIDSYTHAGKIHLYPGPFSIVATMPVTGAATAWYLGTWSKGTGYPSCGCFHQNRLVVAGASSFPQEVDGSNVGLFENFAPSDPATLNVADNRSFQFNLNSSDSNALRWLASTAQGLLSGSYVAEWLVSPSSSSEALTPTNVNAMQTSFYGAADMQPVQAGNGTFYVQRAQRKIRELTYFFQSGTFRSNDMTELSEHITLPQVTQLAVQKETQPLIWAVRTDGLLLSMVYNRDDASLIAGWTRHQLGGQSDAAGTNPIVTSIGVIPAPDTTFDQMWLVVKRYINGSTVYTIEYMTKIYDTSIVQEDAFQLSCGASYDTSKTISGISIANPCVVTATAHGFSNGNYVKITDVIGLNISTTDADGNVTISNLVNEKTFVVAGVAANTFQLHDFSGNAISSVGYSAWVSGGTVRKLITTISGLTWLENETVSVLADGGVHPDCVVSNAGVLTLRYPAAKVQIGYGYNSDMQLLRAEAGAADGTSIGKTRRTSRIAVQLYNSGDLNTGTSFTRLLPSELISADSQAADTAPPLYSGIIREGVESAYDFESQLCVRQAGPLPGSIISITSFMEEFDV